MSDARDGMRKIALDTTVEMLVPESNAAIMRNDKETHPPWVILYSRPLEDMNILTFVCSRVINFGETGGDVFSWMFSDFEFKEFARIVSRISDGAKDEAINWKTGDAEACLEKWGARTEEEKDET